VALTATLLVCFGGLSLWRSKLLAASLRFERYEARHSHEDPSALYKLGKAYSDAGYLQPAIRHLEIAAERAERPFLQAGVLSELGTAYGRDGRDLLAVSVLKRSLELRPDLSGTRESLATALLRLGRPEEAVGYLQKAIERDPSRPGPRVNLAQAYIELGDLQRADQLLSEARLRFPDDAIVYVAEAVLESRWHNWHAAVGYLERAVKLDPQRAATWRRLAAAYQAVGRSEDATRAFERARRLSDTTSVSGRR
jgi:tetratricopeptide (TPR) repeat protein